MNKIKFLKIIPLGGLSEVGRNMMLLEWQNKILIIDCGLRMPEEDMPGIDYLIPNSAYLKNNKEKVIAIIFTHGHYDHIGGFPYLLDRIGLKPIFTGRLTKGILLKREEEFTHHPSLDITEVFDGSIIKLGPFLIEFFHLNHNIPDNLGLFIQTPVGNIINTSDFKFDKNPVNDVPTDFNKLKKFKQRKVLLLMSDSTGAEEEGYSLSEKIIMKNLEEIFKKAKKKIITATFSSLINRVQQIITLSEKYNRKVVVTGYSMKANIEIAKKLNYIKTKKGTFISEKNISRYPESKITIICTGAQGENRASLVKIANGENKFIKLKKGDSVIFSSSIIPGNERTVQILKDDLYRGGVKVFHYKMMDIHSGGHAKKEDLKKMINIIKPKFFIPIHGQYSMLANHAELAKSQKIKEENIVIPENGDIVNLNQKKIFVEKGKVPANYVMVDGLGVGDVGDVVLRDRQNLSKDGMFVVIAIIDHQTGLVKGSPDIISRGFIYLRESKNLLKETRKKVINIIEKNPYSSSKGVNWVYLKNEIKDKIGNFLFYKTKRRPMVLPVIIEV